MSVKFIGLSLIALAVFAFFQTQSAVKESDIQNLLSHTTANAAQYPENESAPAKGRTPARVDQSALRYFAIQKDMKRFEREVARLQALYPDWDPPKDPSEVEEATDPELDRLWQMLSEERYVDLRGGIAEWQQREPLWVPPSELINLLEIGERRTRIVNASVSGQHQEVIEIAETAPDLMSCGDVDVLWRLAEAFVATKQSARAKEIYAFVLQNCTDSSERLATGQKAAKHLSRADIVELFKFERNAEFNQIRDLMARDAIARIVDGNQKTAKPDDLARLTAMASRSTGSSDHVLLGWYYLHRGDGAKALDWFREASTRSPDNAKAAEGYIRSLIVLDRFAEAEEAAYPWVYVSDDNLAAYLDAAVSFLSLDPPTAIPQHVLERMRSVAMNLRHFKLGESLGWYAYKIDQTDAAALWFDKALQWAPGSPSAVEGMSAILAEKAVTAFDAERYSETINVLELRSRYAPPQNDLLVLKGFAYMKLKRYFEAKRIFKTVAATGYPDAERGLIAVDKLIYRTRR